MLNINPTHKTYNAINSAYAFFNDRLFDGALPHCLVTLQRKPKSRGYFAGGKFGSRDGGEITDELALNPSSFRDRSAEEILSTLVHEMVHVWQHHHGERPRVSYHDKQWAAKMREVGLIPSDTGQPGGKETGQKMTHYIEPGGRYQVAFAELDAAGCDDLYVELWSDAEARKKRQAKAASKTRFTCPSCGLKAWAKSAARLMCGECEVPMEAE
jgi:hypothetical protein